MREYENRLGKMTVLESFELFRWLFGMNILSERISKNVSVLGSFRALLAARDQSRRNS